MQAELDELDNLLKSLEVPTDDFFGELPIDFRDIDFCQVDTPVVEKPAMTMEDIEDLLNSDEIQKLCDSSAM